MTVFEQIFNEVITPYLEPRIKKSSLQAVKTYVKGVEKARKVAIASYGLGTAASILVTGVILMIVAVLGLLPIAPVTALISMLVLGAILTIGSIVVVVKGLSQATWIEKSKSNEMIEAAMKPWETPYSIPDPRKILSPEQDSYDKNRELKTSRANRVPAPTAYDTIDAHAPPATYPSLTTTDAALVTRSIDTTNSLRP